LAIVARAIRPSGSGLPRNASLTGLRGVAILVVVAFHLGLPVAEGGPVGVTLFFVLSGYLITRLLCSEFDATGMIDLPRFAIRRARRLLPALIFAVVVTSLIAAGAGHHSASRDGLVTLTYVAIWARAAGDGMGLWNHAWSLSIEEQFYLVWPVVFVVLSMRIRMTSDATVVILLVLAAVSAVLRGVLTNAGLDARAYFGTDTRAEALLLGCALGLALARRPSSPVPAWLGPVGLAAVLFLAVVPTRSFLWPGALYSVTAVASCALLVGLERSRGRTLGLASRPLVWLGERSYSLYLWHVPVILLIGPMLPASGVRLAIVATVSIGLAAMSYAYVEAPFRRTATRGPRLGNEALAPSLGPTAVQPEGARALARGAHETTLAAEAGGVDVVGISW
jgi:peptidoglycan/LPS O-acetylase OafA/YrhL